MAIRYLQGVSLEEVVSHISRLKEEGSRDIKVRQLAELVVTGQSDQVRAVHHFAQTFPYQPDPENMELFIHPRRVAQDYFIGRVRRFDCDDSALFISALLSSLGYETRIQLVEIEGPGLDHAFSEVKTPIGWIKVDAVSKAPMGWLGKYKHVVTVP